MRPRQALPWRRAGNTSGGTAAAARGGYEPRSEPMAVISRVAKAAKTLFFINHDLSGRINTKGASGQVAHSASPPRLTRRAGGETIVKAFCPARARAADTRTADSSEASLGQFYAKGTRYISRTWAATAVCNARSTFCHPRLPQGPERGVAQTLVGTPCMGLP
jgi:hypothetical protein